MITFLTPDRRNPDRSRLNKSSPPDRPHPFPFLRGFFLLLLVFLFPSCEFSYISQEGTQMIRRRMEARPVEEVIGDPEVPLDHKLDLLDIQKMRAFAREEANLTVGDHYTTYVKTNEQSAAWVVSAARDDSVRSMQWSFPVVGALPYRGYFSPERALQMRDHLEASGYHTKVSGVPAFSTIGWLDDPVYTAMLDRPRFLLAETIFHELVHATFFDPNDVGMSEASATVIGERAALQYLKKREGSDSRIVKTARAYFRDRNRVAHFFQNLSSEVKHLYDASPFGNHREKRRQLLRRRRFDFLELCRDLETNGWEQIVRHDWNNAYLAQRGLYYGEYRRLKILWKDEFAPDLAAFVSYVRTEQD